MKKHIKKLFNFDGFTNLFTNMNTNLSRSGNTEYRGLLQLNRGLLDDLFCSNGFANKIVTIPAEDMVRQWIEIENDTDNYYSEQLEELDAKERIVDALTWARLYGGSVILMGIDDGGDLTMPLNPARIKKLDFLKVYDRHQVTWIDSYLTDDPNSERYGEPEFYTFNPYAGSTPFNVHYSRMIIVDGDKLPPRLRHANNGWGQSVMQKVYENLKEFGIVNTGAADIINDFMQTILNINNLVDLVAQGKEEEVRKRLELIDLGRGMNNTILLDGEEKYTKQASSVAGVDKVMQQFAVLLAGVSDIPTTRLFNQSPAGQNSTGESDMRNYYDSLKSKQVAQVLPIIKQLMDVLQVQKGAKAPADDTGKLVIKFNPLWQKTDKEDAEHKKLVAETDKAYIESGVLHPEEVTLSRFANGYSADTVVDMDARPEETEEPEDEPEAPSDN